MISGAALMMPRRAPSKVRKTIIFNSYRSIRSRDRDTIVKESRSSRCRRRFCQTLSHFANPLDLCDQHFLLDMNFLGTPQLRAGVDVLFFFKVSHVKHPNRQSSDPSCTQIGPFFHFTGGYLGSSYPEGNADRTSLGGWQSDLKFGKIVAGVMTIATL